MFIEYTAKRNLASGHTAGVNYTLESEITADAPSIDSVKEQATSFSGRQMTNLIRMEYRWNIRTSAVGTADYELWAEFAASVAAGETFTLDVYGTQAVPDNPQTMRLVGSPPKITRISTIEYWNITFEAELDA